MSKNRIQNQRSRTAQYLIIIFVIFVLIGIVFFTPEPENTTPIIVQATAQVPTVTSIPVPDTLEEIKSECSRGECVHACMAHVDTVLQQARHEFPEYNAEDVELVYYGISKSDELEKPRDFDVSGNLLSLRENTDTHNLVWNYFKTLFSREIRPDLVTFGIYISSTSDGKFDTTLYKNWIVKFNILALEDVYFLTNAMIHEYGHYLTLNRSQVDSSNICRQEGLYFCEAADSYLYLFFLDFWEDIYPEWKDIDWQSSHYEEEIGSFYQKYKERFLNDYASTDPVEDIAESWTAFVIDPKPSGNLMAEQKINFFYKFPELVELRYQIIKGICTFEQNQ